MKTNRIFIGLLVMIFSFTAINTQAQLGKIGKNLKKKAEKTVKNATKTTKSTKTSTKKVSIGGASEECIRCTKDLENRTSSIEKRLSEGNIKTVASSISNLPKYINRYKDAKCPGLEKWEAKKTELEQQFNIKLAEKFPQAVLVDGVIKNDKKQVDVALEKGAEIDKKIGDISFKIYQELGKRSYFDVDYSENAIMAATSANNLEMLKYLVGKGATIQADYGGTLLLNSVKNKNLEMTKFLLDKGADPRSSDKRLAASKDETIEAELVFTAAKNDDLEMIKEFDKRSNIDILLYKYAAYKAQTALESSPEGSKTREYLTQKVIETKKAKVKDATNLKYAKRIVLSTEKIPDMSANSSKFGTKFQAVKTIYARIYFGCLLSEFFYGEKSLSPNYSRKTIDIKVQVNGNDYYLTALDTEKDDPTSLEIPINTSKYRRNYHELSLLGLKQGENKVKITATMDKEVIASEEIILVKKPGDYYPMNKKLANFKAGAMNTPTYKSAILKAIQTHAAAAGWKEKFGAVKIISNDWNIVRNELTGIVLYRTIGAWCYAKWPDGHCTVQDFYFKQDYNGSSYSKTFKRSSNGSQEWVDCN